MCCARWKSAACCPLQGNAPHDPFDRPRPRRAYRHLRHPGHALRYRGRLAPRRLAPIIDRAAAAGVHLLVQRQHRRVLRPRHRRGRGMDAEVPGRSRAGPLLSGVGRQLADARRLARREGRRRRRADGPPAARPLRRAARRRRSSAASPRRRRAAARPLPPQRRHRPAAIEALAGCGGVAVKWATPNPMGSPRRSPRRTRDLLHLRPRRAWAPPMMGWGPGASPPA